MHTHVGVWQHVCRGAHVHCEYLYDVVLHSCLLAPVYTHVAVSAVCRWAHGPQGVCLCTRTSHGNWVSYMFEAATFSPQRSPTRKS